MGSEQDAEDGKTSHERAERRCTTLAMVGEGKREQGKGGGDKGTISKKRANRSELWHSVRNGGRR